MADPEDEERPLAGLLADLREEIRNFSEHDAFRTHAMQDAIDLVYKILDRLASKGSE